MNERRQVARMSADGIRCSGGRVIDLSARGMRICARRPWVEGERRTIALRRGLRSVEVNAVCVWTRREGPFRHVAGLAFADIAADEMATLTAMTVHEANPMRRAA